MYKRYIILNISLIISIYIIPIFWIGYHFKKRDISIRYYLSKPTSFPLKKIFLSAIMTMFFGLGMLLLVVTFLSLILPESSSTEKTNEIVESYSMWFILFKALILAFMAPICEEILFRGFLLGRFTYKFGLKRAIVFSSICFGVLHITNVFGATMLGIISCLLYLKTKSLLPSIIAHLINNIIVASRDVIFALQSTTNVEQPSEEPELTIVLIMSLSLMSIGLMWIIPFIKRHWGLIKKR